jgi:appr-1-p processing enzyme family|nr:MAG TPA: Poa1p-like protein [Caudoviricetes sp.]
MIEFRTGDIFESEAEAIVNTVNCVGVMGRGLALQFKNKYPANFRAYQQTCKKGLVKPGKMFVFTTKNPLPKWIINFPAKRHWLEKSCIEDIELGLIDLVNVIQEKNIQSIAIPPLGAGLGGLEWLQVRVRIEHALSHIENVEIFVYEPNKAFE